MNGRLCLVALCVLAAACGSDPMSSPQRSTSQGLFGKAPPRSVDSRIQLYLYRTLSDGATATKLYGDGRDLDGSALATPDVTPSAYDGEAQCATRGTIDWYAAPKTATGDAFFAPTGGTSPLCQGTARSITADLGAGSPASLASTVTIQQVMDLAIGQARTQTAMWVWNQTGCARLKYDVTSGSGVRVIRLSGDSNRNAGTWSVESQGNHVAGCYNFGKGNALVHTGPDYYLPFSAQIVEVLR